MSDETTTPPLPYRATPNDVLKYLQSREKASACPVCGENNWQLFTEFDMQNGAPAADLVAIGVSSNGSHFINPPTLPLIALICNNCAYTRFHAKKLIEHVVSQSQGELPGVPVIDEESHG